MKNLKKFIACFLVMILASNLIGQNAYAESNNTIIVEGHTFEIVTNTPEIVSIACTENGITYYESMNKDTRNVAIKETKNSLLSKETMGSYNVKINSFDSNNINYTVTDNILKTRKVKTENYNHIYNKTINNSKNNLNDGLLHGQTVVDLGITLIILLAALVILTIAYVVYTHEGIDYEYWSDVVGYIRSLSGSQQKVYYYACRYGGYALVGNAFTNYTECLAYTKLMLSNDRFGVYCYQGGPARSLATVAGSYYGCYSEDIHGAQPAYQYHTHPMKTSTTHYEEHIWYSK